jgi:hypothetical protein
VGGFSQKMRYIFYILGTLLFCLSCNNKQDRLSVALELAGENRAELEKVLAFYSSNPADSLKYRAAVFLIENISTHYSDIPIFTNRITGEETPLDLLSIENDSVLIETFRQLNLTIDFKTVSDASIISSEFLLHDIEQAFGLWNKYSWANQVPFDVFLNYLLPYKIHGEEPYDWRSYFTQRYTYSVNSLLNSAVPHTLACTNTAHYRLLVSRLWWFRYEDNPISLTRYPGFRELMALKSGDCFGWSYLQVMILRSLGIPSAIDHVPLWGRRNAGHVSDVFWDNERQQFRTGGGREFRYPTKVFRHTFKQQGTWSDVIQPTVQQNPFLLDFLKHDHWLDVTHEHTATVTVEHEWALPTNFAYICVFNYRQWEPVFWGKVKNGKVRFDNMGAEMLYRIAVPTEDSFELIGSIFHLDEEGNKTFFEPDSTNQITMQLHGVNTGSRSLVRAGVSYSLYYYDGNGNWNLLQTQESERDYTIVFEGVPANTLYILQNDELERPLERIFTYENGKQVWW